LRIVGIHGGHGIRRRLLAMGFHRGDTIELDSMGIFRGPVLVRNLTSDTSVALGRGIAERIIVEIIGEKE